ncbi:hypothetical protein DBV05_g12227 [Lasiodiplodia theobromae]|uniref:F-box domain-containing protein n=1 Tax=Lasiodiplodia theobromae TaxID=45133 RepID=A0A5N5CUU7_9PEZI|nr:hypothetical protein DBV05_g12227 [Lasiodiplodia theobromae]
MSRISAFGALPAELIEEVAGYLNSKDCCSLRQASLQLYFKADYIFRKHCTHVQVDFDQVRLAQLCTTSQNTGMARAVKILTIVVPDEVRKGGKNAGLLHACMNGQAKNTINEEIQAAVDNSCCSTGACGSLLTKSLRQMVNVTDVRITGNYLDMAHIKCSGMSLIPCRSRDTRHRAVPAILNAVKNSGITTPISLSITELTRRRDHHPVKKTHDTSPRCFNPLPELDAAVLTNVHQLRLGLGGRRLPKRVALSDVAALRHSLPFTPALTLLELSGPHPGLLNSAFELMADAGYSAFPALRSLRLADDATVDGVQLAVCLQALVPQLEELSLVGLALADDAMHWVDALRCIRVNLSSRLQRFRFARNAHAGELLQSHALTLWDADGDGAACVRDVDVAQFGKWARWMFEDVDEWVAVFALDDDDGEAFEDVAARVGGVGAAIDVLIQGYYEAPESLDEFLFYCLL